MKTLPRELKVALTEVSGAARGMGEVREQQDWWQLSLLTSISLRTMSTMLPITTRASNTFQASPK